MAGFEKVLECIDTAIALGVPSIKVNCDVIRNVNDDECTDFVEFIKDRPIGLRFIEYMPFDGSHRLYIQAETDGRKSVERRKVGAVQGILGANNGTLSGNSAGGDGRTRYVKILSCSRVQGHRRLHLVHDGALLRRLQSHSLDGRW
jgi:cyclic pyranopterin phosphate synthase